MFTIIASSTTKQILSIPASSEVFEHNLWALNSLSQPPAVSESITSEDRRYSIDAAVVAFSWANSLISDLYICVTVTMLELDWVGMIGSSDGLTNGYHTQLETDFQSWHSGAQLNLPEPFSSVLMNHKHMKTEFD